MHLSMCNYAHNILYSLRHAQCIVHGPCHVHECACCGLDSRATRLRNPAILLLIFVCVWDPWGWGGGGKWVIKKLEYGTLNTKIRSLNLKAWTTFLWKQFLTFYCIDFGVILGCFWCNIAIMVPLARWFHSA